MLNRARARSRSRHTAVKHLYFNNKPNILNHFDTFLYFHNRREIMQMIFNINWYVIIMSYEKNKIFTIRTCKNALIKLDKRTAILAWLEKNSSEPYAISPCNTKSSFFIL